MFKMTTLATCLLASAATLTVASAVHADNAYSSGSGQASPPLVMARPEPPLVRVGVPGAMDARVHFAFDRSRLQAADTATLNQLMGRMARLNPDRGMGRVGFVTAIEVTGHTDSIGSARYNQRLGLRRARTVRNYLVAQGLNEAAIGTRSLGEQQPVASNRTPQGRAENRRADISVSTVQAH